MTHKIPGSRLVEIPAEHIDYAKLVVERVGIVRACEVLGTSKIALLGVLARGAAMPGTGAILAIAYSRREAA
ncbi:MAG TPA: hypothetical protein VH062_10265 [Polyangiaceae bacterium]|jgi:hypothetical protein|nr:hypothetical protein [Polyangiaceae bacterium]